MRCRVLLFAHLAERAGVREVELELAEGETGTDALSALVRAVPALDPLPRVAIAIDEQYADPGAIIPDGAVLALIPPVSGG